VRQAENPIHQRLELHGARGRLHAVRPAHEQLMSENVAQALERMTDRRLRQPEAFADRAQLALPQQLGEHQQQCHVETPDIDLVELRHDANSLANDIHPIHMAA